MRTFLLGECAKEICEVCGNIMDANEVVSRIHRLNRALDSFRNPSNPLVPMSRTPYKLLSLDESLEDLIITEFVKDTDSHANDLKFIESIKKYLSEKLFSDKLQWANDIFNEFDSIIKNKTEFTDHILDCLESCGDISDDYNTGIAVCIALKYPSLGKVSYVEIVNQIVNNVYDLSNYTTKEIKIKIRAELEEIIDIVDNEALCNI